MLEVAGERMSQSGAILMWLAATIGKFAPKAEERFEALRWLFFDNHRFTNNYAMHRFQKSFTPRAVDRLFWLSCGRAWKVRSRSPTST